MVKASAKKARLPRYTFAQSIRMRTSYQDEEIEMDARFEKVMDYSKLDEITKTV